MIAQATGRPATAVVRRAASPLVPLLRAGSDFLLIALGFVLAYVVRYTREIGGQIDPEDYRPLASFVPVILILGTVLLTVYAFRGLYRLPRWTGFLDEASLVVGGALTGFAAVIVLVFYYRQLYFSRLIFLYALAFVVALLLAKRLVVHGLHSWMRARGRWLDRALVIGTGAAGRRVMSALLGEPRLGYEIVGVVDDGPLPPDWAIATQRGVQRPVHLGSCHDLHEVIRRYAVDEVIVALQPTEHDQILWVIEQCRAERIAFTLVPDLFALSLDRVEVHDLNGLPLISVPDAGIRGWNLAVKRAADVVLGGILLLISAVPLVLIALLIRLDSPGPALLRQVRVGRDGRPFRCFKFRTMVQDADKLKARLAASADYTGDRVLFKLRDDPRRTRVGRWLRRTSLDELPNLFNVLRGEMSLVGPRPAVPEEVALYEPWHHQRLAVMPGMTGLWQVNGRSDLTFDEMVRLDLYYAEHWSLWLDLKIMLRTIPAVLTGRGAY